ncbi:MAG: sporulation regulator WhiA, partial [Acidaminococcaceae bacterium]|nr:sporulation regulator WhiA [Acidaminococcaceae bacterium]
NELVEYTEGTVGKSGLNHRLKKIRQIAVNEGLDISEYV